MNGNLRVLGIDPGLERTGWAFVEKRQNSEPVICSAGLIKTSPLDSLPGRLAKIYDELSLIIERYSPCDAAIEEVYFNKKAGSQKNTMYARGVILLALHKAAIKIAEYNPRTVKSLFCANGNADKNQMMKTVMLVFSLKSPLKPDDVSDAAAIAFIHLRNKNFTCAVERGIKK